MPLAPSHCPTAPCSPEQLAREARLSLWLALSVLCVLTVAKAVARVPYVGPAALSLAVFWQLQAPLGRIEHHNLGLGALGLRLDAWRVDMRWAAMLALVFLPVYAAAFHLWAVYGPQLAHSCGCAGWAPPTAATALWHMPRGAPAWRAALAWFAQRACTHTLGVALPEELFYRGYLQPVWQAYWPARFRLARAPFGWASVAACGAFALGHFLGEWHLGRLGPFAPSLLFAWQRARSGTIVGSIGLHAACNLFAEVWACQYVPGRLEL